MATSKRGFASMDPSKQREIASKGGRAAHSKGTAHEFTSDEARVAGRKGGEAVSRDRAHMAAIGREGGHSRGARARAAAANPNPVSGSIGNTDFEQSTGSQQFVRPANEERSSFETGSGRSGGFQERPQERPASSSNRSDDVNEGGLLSNRERDRDRF